LELGKGVLVLWSLFTHLGFTSEAKRRGGSENGKKGSCSGYDAGRGKAKWDLRCGGGLNQRALGQRGGGAED